MPFMLGKAPPKLHPKTLQLGNFLTGVLPTPAEKVYREYKTPASSMLMLGNDQYGDCTCAGILNKFIHDAAHTGVTLQPTTAEALALYSAVTGFSAGPPVVNDNGAAMTDILNYARTTGITIGGKVYKILAWAQIDQTNLLHRQIGCDMFGGTYTGVQLPASAQDQFIEGKQCSFEVVPGSPIEGGHCIFHPGYGSEGDDYVTWANWFVKASAAWSAQYVDEEYCIITQQWVDRITTQGTQSLNIDALLSTISQL